MNSSDSEEDFESADEEIDLKNPLEQTYQDEDTKDALVEKDLSEKSSNEISPVESATEILDKIEQVNFKESTDSASKNIQSVESTPHEENELIRADSPKFEDSKNKPSLKKLGKKISTNESILQPEDDNLHSKPDYLNEKNDKGRKLKPAKLGMKLTTGVVKDKFNIKDDANKVLAGNNDAVKSEKCLENDESSRPTIPEENVMTESSGKTSKSFQKPEEINFETGDGWELEEGDGFAIPITLSKSGDGGIQCSQEQISELDQVEFKPSKTEQEQGWADWGGWGVTSLLSTATGTVTTFSSHVTAGLSTVLETTVGAPDPETLAGEQVSHYTMKEDPTNEHEKDQGYGGLGSIVSGVSFLGSSVINRGLDTLETIGKKTMEVLQEGDPGLKKKRAIFFQNQDKPILSQILREAKDKADSSDKEKEEKEATRKVHFESLFDDFQGMVHLEALEMLSTQCDLKLQSLLQSHFGSQLLDLQETLSQVRDLCELAEEEEDSEVLNNEQFAEQVTDCVEGLGVKITPTKILKVNNEIYERLEQLESQSATVVNQTAISSLAELTAAAMEYFHKSAELVMAKSHHNTANEADSYVRLTNHLCGRVSAVANEFTQLLTKNDPIANSSIITNIFLEASNSCSYMKNACQLLVPILQVGAIAS